MLLPSSADELSHISPNPCEDEEQKMLSLDQQVAAQNVYNMSETAAFEPKINETCIVLWEKSDGQKCYLLLGTKVMD